MVGGTDGMDGMATSPNPNRVSSQEHAPS